MKPILSLAIAVAIVATVALPLNAWANSIPITNASFESPAVGGATYGPYVDPNAVDGWVLSGDPGAWAWGGVWNVSNNLGGCPGDCWNPATAPDGAQIGWLSVGGAPGTPATMSQALGVNLLANRTYTLTGVYGHPLNFQSGTVFTAALYTVGGAVPLLTFSGTGPEADFAPFNASWFSGTHSEVGNELEIRLSSNKAQTGFDNIALSVPDGGMTAILLGIAMTAVALFRRSLG